MAVRKANDKFHHNFKEGMQAHPFGYKGVNLDLMIEVQK
jgi:hypothetical protein